MFEGLPDPRGPPCREVCGSLIYTTKTISSNAQFFNCSPEFRFILWNPARVSLLSDVCHMSRPPPSSSIFMTLVTYGSVYKLRRSLLSNFLLPPATLTLTPNLLLFCTFELRCGSMRLDGFCVVITRPDWVRCAPAWVAVFLLIYILSTITSQVEHTAQTSFPRNYKGDIYKHYTVDMNECPRTRMQV